MQYNLYSSTEWKKNLAITRHVLKREGEAMLETPLAMGNRPWRWSVFEEYRFERTEKEPEGILVTQGKILKVLPSSSLGLTAEGRTQPHAISEHQYEPLDHPELPAELANLHGATDTAVLEFAHRWGFLGHGELMRLSREPRRLFPPTHPESTSTDREPVAWIRAHARNAWLALRILNELESLSSEASEYVVDEGLINSLLLPREEPSDDWIIACAVYLTDEIKTAMFRGGNWVFQEEQVPILLNHAIVSMLRGTLQRAILDFYGTPETQFTFQFAFDSLLEAIYWHLANAAVRQSSLGPGRYSQCRWCGKFSLRTHSRQRFCSPQPGQRESRCAVARNVERMRQLRRRRRGETDMMMTKPTRIEVETGLSPSGEADRGQVNQRGVER